MTPKPKPQSQRARPQQQKQPPPPPPPPPPQQQQQRKEEPTATEDQSTEHVDCIICSDPIQWCAVGSCNHIVCHICSLRMRALYKQRQCSYCKADLDQVIFTENKTKPFDDYQLPRLKYDLKLGIYFNSQQIYEETMVLLRFNCPHPECPVACPGGWPELKSHVKKHHDMLMCELCTRDKKVFTHEHTLFTSETLRIHERDGDNDDTSFKGHPECSFCRLRFYGLDELYKHCQEHHEQCFLCQRRGLHNQYFMNYRQLEEHFNADHFPCMKPGCLENKFVVFDSDIDLQAHDLDTHADSRSKARGAQIKVNFDYGGPSSLGPRDGDRNRQSNRGHGRRPGGNDGGTGVPDVDDDRRAPRRAPPPGFGSQLTSVPTPDTASGSASSARANGRKQGSSSNALNDARAAVPSANSDHATRSLANMRLSEVAASAYTSPSRPARAAPTPAEAAALLNQREQALQQQQLQQQNNAASIAGGLGEPDVVAGLQRLFDVSASTHFIEFKSIMREFRSNAITATAFLDGFARLALANKTGKRLDDARLELGRVWHRLIDTYPEEHGMDVNTAIETQQDGRSNKNKKKKKAMSLAEFEAVRRGVPKREAMLKAWNDYRARMASETQDVSVGLRRVGKNSESAWPGSASMVSNTSTAAASTTTTTSSSSSSSTSNARVLVIKSASKSNRMHALARAFPSDAGYISLRPGESSSSAEVSSPQRGTVSRASTPSISNTSMSGSQSVRQTPSSSPTITSLTSASLSSQRPSSTILGAATSVATPLSVPMPTPVSVPASTPTIASHQIGRKLHNNEEFPGLPATERQLRPSSSMRRGAPHNRLNSQQPSNGVVTNAWSAASASSERGYGDGDDDMNTQSSKKKNKKGKTVLLHFG